MKIDKLFTDILKSEFKWENGKLNHSDKWHVVHGDGVTGYFSMHAGWSIPKKYDYLNMSGAYLLETTHDNYNQLFGGTDCICSGNELKLHTVTMLNDGRELYIYSFKDTYIGLDTKILFKYIKNSPDIHLYGTGEKSTVYIKDDSMPFVTGIILPINLNGVQF